MQNTQSTSDIEDSSNPLNFARANSNLFKLLIPIFLSQIAQGGYALVDTVMAGRYSAIDLAIVAVGAGIWLPVFLFSLGIMIATTPLIGEVIGKNKLDKVPYLQQQSLWLAFFVGIISAIILYFATYTFDWLDVPIEIQKQTADYIHWVALGFPATAMYTSMRCYNESLGHVYVVMFIAVVGVMLNIPLNYIFMNGVFGLPELGGVGCGISTAFLMWFSLLMIIVYNTFSKKFAHVRFYSNFAKPHLPTMKRIFWLGLPIGIAIFFEVSLFSMGALIVSPLGPLTVAANQVVQSITAQFFMIPMSIAMALSILVSRYYGAKNWQAIRFIQRIGIGYAVIIAIVNIIIIVLFGEQITHLFTNDLRIVTIATHLLFFILFYQVADAIQVVISGGFLRGIQDTAITMYICFISYFCIGIPLGIYLTRYTDMGAQGFWIGCAVGLNVSCVLHLLRMRQQNKKLGITPH